MAPSGRRASFLDWLFVTADWKISSGRMKKRRYDFEAFPCQIDLARDESDDLSVMKSAQMAISEMFTIARPFWQMDVQRRNWGILFPTQTAMRDFFRSRLKAALSATTYLRKNVSGENESTITAFGRSLFLRYTTTDAAISTFDADGATVDELDLHNMDNLYGAMVSRTQGSYDDTPWYKVSTPTYPMFGVHQELLTSDHRVWLIRCGGCGYENDLTEKIGEYDAHDIELYFKDFLSDERFPRWEDYYVPCSGCGKPIDPVARLDSVGAGETGGRWVARHPHRDRRGYHLQIFQRRYRGGTPAVLNRMRNGLLRATGDPTLVKNWWNYTLGIPFTPREGRLTDEIIANASRSGDLVYRLTNIAHNHVHVIDAEPAMWMGIDVRDQQYHVWALGSHGGDHKVCVAAGWVEDAAAVLELWRWMGKPVTLIDNEPNLSDTRKIVAAMGTRGFRAKFAGGIHQTWQKSQDSDLLLVNRAVIMQETKAMIEDRWWVVPEALWDVGSGITHRFTKQEETARDHFKAPVMVKRDDARTGNTVYDYPLEAMGGVDPHFFMAACLAQVATKVRAAPGFVARRPV